MRAYSIRDCPSSDPTIPAIQSIVTASGNGSSRCPVTITASFDRKRSLPYRLRHGFATAYGAGAAAGVRAVVIWVNTAPI